MIVGGSEVHRTFVQGNAAMANMQTLVGRIGIVPDLGARAGINSPNVIGYRYIQNTVSDNGRRLDLGCLACLKGPGECEFTHIRWSNLTQMTVTLAGVVAVIY